MAEHQCGHCRRPVNGHATRTRTYAGVAWTDHLCHPPYNDAPDCYRLVTVYGHPTPCTCTEETADG